MGVKACLEKNSISKRIQSVEVESLNFFFFSGGGENLVLYMSLVLVTSMFSQTLRSGDYEFAERERVVNIFV
jgi:hypothetical protein